MLVTPRNGLSSYPPVSQLKGDKLSLQGPTSHVKVAAAGFVEACEKSVHPDAIVALHEVPGLGKPGLNVGKYLAKVAKRTAEWFEIQRKGLSPDPGAMLLLPVIGQSAEIVSSILETLKEAKSMGVAYVPGIACSQERIVSFGRQTAASTGRSCAVRSGEYRE